jgi:DNA-binding MarR family transcriptional regulator
VRRLTQRQYDVLNYIIDCKDAGKAPTISEVLGKFPEIKHRSLVARVYDSLEAKRYIRRIPNKRRGVIVLREP